VKTSGEIHLLTDWGQVTLKNEVRDWVEKLKEGGAPWPERPNTLQSCKYDVDNLKLSARAFGSSSYWGQVVWLRPKVLLS